MKSDIRRRRIISALQTGFGGGGGSPVYGLYPSTDRAILAGIGSLDYLSFLSMDINVINGNNIMGLTYREGSDHNSSANANILAIRAAAVTDFDNISWSAASVAVAQDGVNKYTNPSITFTSTGRTIVFYTSFTGSDFHLYYKYSDDFLTVVDVTTATWSSQFEMTTDYPPASNDGILGQGRAIEYQGVLYKACHAIVNGSSNYEGPIYKSEDDGLTWTFHAFMYPSSVAQYEEPCILMLEDGTMVGLLRSQNNTTCSITRSVTPFTSWSTPEIAFTSNGKNPLAVSPRNTILAMGRGVGVPNGGLTLMASSKNGGTDDWTSGLIDARLGAYMYGDWVWHPGIGAFVGAYSHLSYLGDEGGPTTIIMKLVEESSTIIEPPTTYIPEYQEILDFSIAQSRTPPSQEALRDYHQDFITGLKSDGLYAEIDRLLVFMQNDATLGDFVKTGWKTPWGQIVLTNSPTYGVGGYTGNGTSSRIDLGFFPNQLTKFTLNNASAFYYCGTDFAGAGTHDFGTSNGNFSTITNGLFFLPRNATNDISFAVNSSAASTIAGNTNSIGFYQLQRTSSTHMRVFKDGSQFGGDVAQVSVARSTKNITLCATNFNDQVNRFSPRTIGLFGIGSGMAGGELALYNRFNTFKTAIGL